jgi:dihydrofolate reductase
MRKIIVQEFLTLDGVMQAPGDPNEDRSGGFDHGGWQLAYFDDVFGNEILGAFAATGGFLFGRRTYDVFAKFWPNQPADDPLAGTFNEAPKWVVSTTLSEPLPWQNSSLIRDDVPGEIAKIKAQDGKAQDGKDIRVIGSGELVQTLIKHGLVDEYHLIVHPLVLGEGKRLFRQGEATKLRLVSSKPTTKGVLILTYEPARVDAGTETDAGSKKTAISVEEGQPAAL